MKKFLMSVIVLATVLIGSNSFAAERLIEATGSYVMDSRLDETPASATARAREEAKRSAIEKAGVYLQSYSTMIDLELNTDEVKTVAARLLKIQNETAKIEIIEDNLLMFQVTIEALVDDLDENVLKNMMQDKQNLEELTRQNKELQERYDALMSQMEQFKKEFGTADESRRLKIKSEVARNSEKLSAIDELNKGKEFSFAKNWTKSLAAYDSAIKLDPNLAEAYNNRGAVRYELGNFSDAVEDYSSAIRLRANYADAFNNRGNAYAALGQFQNAESDLKAALKLNDSSAVIHNNLGSVYLYLKNFDAAVNEYNLAVRLNPQYADAFYNRAVAYYGQKNFADALIDVKRAMDLNPNDADIQALYKKISSQING